MPNEKIIFQLFCSCCNVRQYGSSDGCDFVFVDDDLNDFDVSVHGSNDARRTEKGTKNLFGKEHSESLSEKTCN